MKQLNITGSNSRDQILQELEAIVVAREAIFYPL
jgi:hypothetical protein